MASFFDELIEEYKEEKSDAAERGKSEKRTLHILLGRFMAAQDLLDKDEFVPLDSLCIVLGLDLTQHNKKSDERMKKRAEEAANV